MFVIKQIARLIMATVLLLAAASTSEPAFAQTTGVGSDEETSLMWKGYDSSIALWRLDQTLTSVVASQNYGPYIGYTPIALTTNIYSDSFVVWSYTDGSISLWTLDSSMMFMSSETFGPYAGWNIAGLSADPLYGSIRLAWKNTNGALSIWVIDPNGDLNNDITLAPLSGYEPSARHKYIGGTVRKVRRVASERYFAHGKRPQEAAAAAMEAHREAVKARGLRPQDLRM